MSTVFKAKANVAISKAEDPREILDYSYEKQLEQLQKVRRAVADVATSRKRLELQQQQLVNQAATLDGQARQALGLGREDLAREALSRATSLQQQLQGIVEQHAQLVAQEQKLTMAAQRLQTQIDAFRTRKETIKATYTAAEAQTKVNEALSGIGEDMADVGLAMQRAEEKTAQMQARASAVDELLATGALPDLTASGDSLQAQLDQAAATGGVDLKLEALRAEMGLPGSAPRRELPAGGQGGPPAESTGGQGQP